ncbi:hypothetical protein Tsubulata_039469 [Turnera subulata]|uniref:Uncharacterized GPI-anchored protein At5g19230-like domain-containing protein n=1 Tax=Turnera subulata TaxID=218843 RepID=A0A9Q0IZE9_9ROSI|nr:hypothetical protein Tsubulata_039469 [Turnera subulata]
MFVDEEDQVLQGINSYRQAKNLPALAKNKKASCLADEIADKLEDKPCSSPQAGNPVLLSDFSDQLSKCGVDINRTRDGVVLPSCVPKLVPTLLLTNYTHTGYAKYMNDSRFTGAGLGSEDDWMVVVLTTSTPVGDFAGAERLVSVLGLGHCLATSTTLLVFVLFHAIFFISSTAKLCNDEEDPVLLGINGYRLAKNLPALAKNKKASCLADKIAGKLEDKPCTSPQAGNPVLLSDFSHQLSKCGVDINRTRVGVVLPTCVPKSAPTLVLTNYTHAGYAKYMNDSRFTGAGLGSEDDWMVVVLTTSTPAGDFAGAEKLVSVETRKRRGNGIG